MSFSQYPEYKESGIEWAKIIPSNWKVLPLYSLAIESVNSNVGMTESNLLSLSYGRVIRKDINSNDGLLPQSFETYQIVEPNQIILRLTDLQNDMRSLRSALVTERGIITSAYLALEPKDIQPRYLSHLLRAYDITKVFYSMGGGLRQSTKFKDLKRLTIITPSKEEQVAISNFLDHETAKIDALIQEQERLIELLKEKRQAVISHAVTKGLDPDVKMKDSGIEWLGEVPEHWEVKKGAYVGRLFGSEQIAEDGISDVGAVPFLKVSSLSEHSFEIQSWDWFITEEIAQGTHTRNNYIVFPKRGAAIFLNKVNIVRQPSVIDPNLMGWQMFEFADIEYIAFALRARKLDELADISTVPQINNKHIYPEKFTLPPLSEQLEIVTFLNTSLRKTDTLITESELAIALLEERRSALISAAVTGQIDVRDFKPQAQAA